MIYRTLIRIPFLGSILEVVNSYVAHGDFRSDERFAPLSYWIKSLWAETLISAAATALMVSQDCTASLSTHSLACKFAAGAFEGSPGSLATSILPNVLGFGIGVYALVFALSATFVRTFHRRARRANKNGELISVLSLNSAMAYPLLVIAAAIALGVIQQGFKDSLPLILASWFLFWYSLVVTVQLIGTLFSMAGLSLLEKTGK